jgi:hypothetical protein
MRIESHFKYDSATISQSKKLGGIYSKSLRCWYFDYNAANYKLISQTFTDLVIDNQKNETQPLAGLTISRDLPIAKSELQLDAAPLCHNPEHITKQFVSTYFAFRIITLGKYWVLRCGIISYQED